MLRITLKGPSVGAQAKRSMAEVDRQVSLAIGMTARKTGSEIRQAVKKNIKSAGNFGPSWFNAVKVDVDPKRGPAERGATIITRFSSGRIGEMAQAFEEGATIQGKPMLWIPLSYTGLTMPAWKFAKTSGGLFSVQRQGGAPLLFSKEDQKPKYFGIEAVHLRKRFNIAEAAQSVVSKIPVWYDQMFERAAKK
jgi:hypothetical protein